MRMRECPCEIHSVLVFKMASKPSSFFLTKNLSGRMQASSDTATPMESFADADGDAAYEARPDPTESEGGNESHTVQVERWNVIIIQQ